jgi:hypothetical protein
LENIAILSSLISQTNFFQMSPVLLLSIAKIGQKVSLEIATINQLCEKKSLSLKKKTIDRTFTRTISRTLASCN